MQNAIRAKKQAEKEHDEREDNEFLDNEADENSGLLDLISNEANTKSGIVRLVCIIFCFSSFESSHLMLNSWKTQSDCSAASVTYLQTFDAKGPN